ncbi:ATP-binding protein [Rhodohalobacter barkolensis]|uniref:Uncharacterized protein n=1 Tax=Rhodohalobacter barkolensis TaxID=2053187 RepID=A0A2N0VKG2_9BACT|nr:ATP-binding protein [Rhodohalobacter barkolensis]PKD44687.1 hypothetical protein CWD77_04275 [Rhodohalobacter barkolensis]
MIQDQKITLAVSRILQRSERHVDIDKLVETFVDIGIFPQLINRNNQILYGRRGTGKTHVLKVLQTEISPDNKIVSLYLDCRTLGSTSQFSDTSLPLKKRCLALFRDILTPIYNTLLEHIVEYPNENAEKAIVALDELLDTITQPIKSYKQDSEVKRIEKEVGKSKTGGLNITSTSPDLSLNYSDKESSTQATEQTFRVNEEDKIIFPSLHKSLSETLELADVELYLLIDEWSSIPEDIQPYLAEFLKRGVLPVNRAVLKIASLEYRSKFKIPNKTPIFGFELGADISTAPDLDDYYVFDRNPEQITDLFSEILLKHLNVDLPVDYLKNKYGISSGKDLASKLFTQRDTLKELSRAAEGVVRDLINIFTNAFFDARKRGRDTIDLKAILEASRQWFEQDKAQDLDDEMHEVLRRIVEDVIGEKKARSFLLPRSLIKHDTIQKLFDARVLHHMQRGYADKDNPGVRYDIYSLDYGTYVDLIGTSKEPQIELFVEDNGADIVVPFDDKRSIRRIILGEEILEQ